jgi:AAA15 family ATPase/GTPase
LRAFDINVEDIKLQEEAVDDLPWHMFSDQFASTLKENLQGKLQKVSFLKRKRGGDYTEMPLSNESTGTKALFGLAGPVIESLSDGHCMIVDEINQSLHPLIVERLIELFSDPKLNQKRAQLVFTSHDTSILSHSKLRRDQIWFMENDGTSAQLIPLSDYSPRKGEALDRGYLGGRYGGLPASNITELYSVWGDHAEAE